MLMGGVDFSDLAYMLKPAEGEVAAVSINYGKFIQTVLDFLIVAMAVFMAIKSINSMKRKEEEAPKEPEPAPEPTKEEVLLSEIRDILRAK